MQISLSTTLIYWKDNKKLIETTTNEKNK